MLKKRTFSVDNEYIEDNHTNSSKSVLGDFYNILFTLFVFVS